MYAGTLISKKTKGIEVSLSENTEGSVELYQSTLCVYGLSNGSKTGIAEHINFSGNDKGDDQKGNICMLPMLLKLPPLPLPINLFTVSRGIWK